MDKESTWEPRLGFRSRLHKVMVLEPVTCMVLYGNHLGYLRLWVFITFFVLLSKEWNFEFYIIVFAKDCDPYVYVSLNGDEKSELHSSE